MLLQDACCCRCCDCSFPYKSAGLSSITAGSSASNSSSAFGETRGRRTGEGEGAQTNQCKGTGTLHTALHTMNSKIGKKGSIEKKFLIHIKVHSLAQNIALVWLLETLSTYMPLIIKFVE